MWAWRPGINIVCHLRSPNTAAVMLQYTFISDSRHLRTSQKMEINGDGDGDDDDDGDIWRLFPAGVGRYSRAIKLLYMEVMNRP